MCVASAGAKGEVRVSVWVLQVAKGEGRVSVCGVCRCKG